MIVSLVGLPGSGKTSLVKLLATRHAAIVLHPGKHAVARGLTTIAFPSRKQLLEIEGLTASFLNAVDEAKAAPLVILDGFPRSVEQAYDLLARQWPVTVVHLQFPADDQFNLSVARQELRVARDQVIVARSALEEQTAVALAHDVPAIELLKESGCRFVTVDAMQPLEVIANVVAQALDLSN